MEILARNATSLRITRMADFQILEDLPSCFVGYMFPKIMESACDDNRMTFVAEYSDVNGVKNSMLISQPHRVFCFFEFKSNF